MLATIFGVFAQGMAHFLNVLTMAGVVLFVMTLIYVPMSFKKTAETENRNFLYLR